MTAKTTPLSSLRERKICLIIFVFILASLTSVDCIFANGFIIPYTLASRFLNSPRSQAQEVKASSGRSIAGGKLIRALNGEGEGNRASGPFMPPIFTFSLPSASKHFNAKNNGKKLLKLKLGPNFRSSSSLEPQSISIDLSALKMSPASSASASPSSSSVSVPSFLPKTSLKQLTRPTSHVLADSPAVSSFEHDSIVEDFLFGDSKQIERNTPSLTNNLPMTAHSSLGDMRDVEEAELSKLLKSGGSASRLSSNERQSPRQLVMSRQFNQMKESESEPVINGIDFDKERDNFNKPRGTFPDKNIPAFPSPLSLSSGNVFTDGKTIRGNFDRQSLAYLSPSTSQRRTSGTTDRKIRDEEMMRSIARAVNEGSSARDEMMRQYEMRTGEKAPDSVFQHSPSGEVNSQLTDLITSWYGPPGGEGDALSDFLLSKVSVDSMPPKHVKTSSLHHPSLVNLANQSKQFKSTATQNEKSIP